jgi:hypothetical protein
MYSFVFSSLPESFQREVLSKCFINTVRQQDGHLLEEMLNDGISEERLVYILGQSLPRIIPNVILNKREVGLEKKVFNFLYVPNFSRMYSHSEFIKI